MQVAIALLTCVAFAAAVPAFAQTATDRPVHRFEISVGGGLLGGESLGAADANLRANDRTPQSFRLFATSSDIARAPLWYARVAYSLSRRFLLEGALTKGHPDIRVSVTSDAEDAAAATITETVDQYFIDGSVLIMLDELRIGARLVPYAAAGGGYLRQLHEGHTLVEHGGVYNAGGGVKYWLLNRRSGVVRTAGLRGDARAYLLHGGISFEDRVRLRLAVSGSVFVGF